MKVYVIKPRGPLRDPLRTIQSLQRIITDVTSDGVDFITTYPLQTLLKTRYVRTGTLGQSWTARTIINADNIEGIIGSNSNMAPYNKWVQGEHGTQTALMRSGGWRSVDDMLRVLRPQLLDRLTEVFEGASLWSR